MDILLKQSDKIGKIFLGHVANTLFATIMVGYDGHRGSIHYLAVEPAVAGNGYGSTLTQIAEDFFGVS